MTDTAERTQTTARTDALDIAAYYVNKGYDVHRHVLHGIDTGLTESVEVWDIADGVTGQMKGRITYHHPERGAQVTWHTERA